MASFVHEFIPLGVMGNERSMAPLPDRRNGRITSDKNLTLMWASKEKESVSGLVN